jgi:hypothetical protein
MMISRKISSSDDIRYHEIAHPCFEVSEPHVVEQLAVNKKILYTAYEAIFETSLLDAARRQLHSSYAPAASVF